MAEGGRGVTIKVGLSRISVALHEGDRILRMTTLATPLPPEARTALSAFFGTLWPDLSLKTLSAVLVCVVPDLSEIVSSQWGERSGRPPEIFTLSGAPFVVDYRPPETLGADRVAAVWGALVRFGESLGPAFMVADFGTHTVTTVLCRGRLLGGAILPGLPLMEKALGAGRVDLARGMGLLGRDSIAEARGWAAQPWKVFLRGWFWEASKPSRASREERKKNWGNPSVSSLPEGSPVLSLRFFLRKFWSVVRLFTMGHGNSWQASERAYRKPVVPAPVSRSGKRVPTSAKIREGSEDRRGEG